MTDDFTPRSEFLRVLRERGFIHQCSDYAGLDEKARSGALVAYIGFDCTAPSLHVGSLVQIMMLHWLQKTGGKPIALMGGGTTMVGDPSGKDETPQAAHRRADRAPTRPASARCSSQLHELRRRQDRRRHARQRGMADQAQLHRVPARRRPAFLGQPHAVDGLGEDALGARPGAFVPRVQLHVPAGLRFRRAQQALRLHAADGRLGPMGQHRHRRRSRPPAGDAAALRADLAADHDRLGRQDGQDRRRRRLARRGDACRPTTTGSSGATPRTPTSAGS